MTEVKDKTYFSVVYDIQRPWDKKWSEIASKPEEDLTPDEKHEIERRKLWNKLIDRFIDELNAIGFRINWSVYLIPEKYYERAKSIVDRYTKRFNDLNVRNDIYILRYHPDSSGLLLSKLKLHMKLRIDKIINRMIDNKEDRVQLKYLKQEIDTLISIAKAFDIDHEMVEYCNNKLKQHGLQFYSLRTNQITLEELM